jgi:hypothetical protein
MRYSFFNRKPEIISNAQFYHSAYAKRTLLINWPYYVSFKRKWTNYVSTHSDWNVMSVVYIYTVRQKLSITWLISIISFLIMNLFQIGLLFSLPVHIYLLICETGYWSIFIYVHMTGCVKCHVYFSTFVFSNESWFFLCRV